MYYKTLSVLLLSATAMAAPEENNYSSVMEELNSVYGYHHTSPGVYTYGVYMLTEPPRSASNPDVQSFVSATNFPTSYENIPDIPSSVAQVIATAVPTTFVQELMTDADARSSLVENAASGKYPDWYSSIPSDVQGFISSYATSVEAEVTSVSTSTSTSSSTETGSSSGSGSGAAAESTGAQSSTSDSGAPVQTGIMGASLAGAAGVLGLAFAL